MKTKKRALEVCVISDVHLGTYGSQATALCNYLETIETEILVLNGDIIDIWQFSKNYFPKSHHQVVRQILKLLSKGTKVYYITGNHDETLGKFKGFSLGDFHIVNKLILNTSAGKTWIFHGDVFDTTMKHSKWVAKLGGKGYDFLILVNTMMNWVSERLGKGKISLSKKVKDSVKGVVKYVNNFEETAAEIAIENNFDFVVCGHIHQPKIREYSNKKGSVTYLNSGDWVENKTALELKNGTWEIHTYNEIKNTLPELEIDDKKALGYEELMREVIQFN